DVEGSRPARGHAHRRLRRRDRGDDRGGGVRGSRRAGEAHRRPRHAGAVLAPAREGVHPPGRRRRRRRARPGCVLGMATETAIDVVMPQMGVSVSEGTITKWLKREGEQVAADEPLLEISTDKVDTEVPSPASGTVVQIFVQEGETVDVGTKLAQIGGSAAAPEPAPAPPPAPVAEAPAPAVPAPAPAAAEASGNGKFVSPVVARIASEHGIDPNAIPGTGRGGRVTKQDILAVVEQGDAPPAQAPAAPQAAPAP